MEALQTHLRALVDAQECMEEDDSPAAVAAAESWRLAGALVAALAQLIPRLRKPSAFVPDAVPLVHGLAVAANEAMQERRESGRDSGGAQYVGDPGAWGTPEDALAGVRAFVTAAADVGPARC